PAPFFPYTTLFRSHVGLVDGLEAADGRAVEKLAGGDRVFVEGAGRDVEVLHHAEEIAESDVDELDPLLVDVRDDLAGIVEHISSIRTCGACCPLGPGARPSRAARPRVGQAYAPRPCAQHG